MEARDFLGFMEAHESDFGLLYGLYMSGTCMV